MPRGSHIRETTLLPFGEVKREHEPDFRPSVGSTMSTCARTYLATDGRSPANWEIDDA
jgi:hypothetical protein